MKNLILTLAFLCSLCCTAQTKTTAVSADSLNSNLNTIDKKLTEIDKRLDKWIEQTDASPLNIITIENEDFAKEANGHLYVDLGLPSGTMWAACNIGATYPYETGLYFAWGETYGYTSAQLSSRNFIWANYKWMISGQADGYHVTKYTFEDGWTSGCWYSNGTYVGSTVDGVTYMNKTELDPEDDAATVNWGNAWQMPTNEQLAELMEKCTWTWTTLNSMNGCQVTGPNGNSIFLPAAGLLSGASLLKSGTEGNYWSNTLHSTLTDSSGNLYMCSRRASYISLSSTGHGYCCWDRYNGRSVRAVLKK